ncbi:uncharacterized protein MYCFIDRAFT_205501 [Pseudocercospora fijiensis CIRAD86]|uniref:Uncharacterized protein n=1 Tax=Pseudocercospora fijiensis (strain CIRAD86) TaxID=383855 RepID=M3AIZ5_PSEFD|nr:uncharacterized protein MYCFIDRAFT_205501 [Pseudocercospora fijiensis CIRAD86]EME77452.1 hypothetical protein MYCFIDRAFT_205501 [Pseudocercospora fijiensis CIRAD86]
MASRSTARRMELSQPPRLPTHTTPTRTSTMDAIPPSEYDCVKEHEWIIRRAYSPGHTSHRSGRSRNFAAHVPLEDAAYVESTRAMKTGLGTKSLRADLCCVVIEPNMCLWQYRCTDLCLLPSSSSTCSAYHGVKRRMGQDYTQVGDAFVRGGYKACTNS